MFLRQSTPRVFRIGPFLNSTDGLTPELGLIIANTDVQLSKNGLAFVNKNVGGLTVDGTRGWYFGTFDQTDTTEIGVFEVEITVAGSLPVWKTYYIISQPVFDALYGISAVGYNTVIPMSSTLSETEHAATQTAIGLIPTTAMRGTDDAATEAKQDVSDLLIVAIEGKTDQMEFTNPGELDGNTRSINNAEVIGNGAGIPWDGVP